MSFIKIKGVIPPILTPFDDIGEIDYEAFEFNLNKWNAYDLAGILVLGSNGETPFITKEEKLKLIEKTVETIDDDKIVMVGTGMESVKETVALTNEAAARGADCALVLTPNYYGGNMHDMAQLHFFTEVADQTEIPILIYNVTKFTHINISPTVVSQLSHHDNIIGMKDSSGDVRQLIELMNAGLDEDFNLIVGTASAWYPALTIGIEAAVLALANCCPQECIEMQTLYEDNQLEKSLQLYKRMYPVNKAITGTFGIPGLKYTSTRLGYKGGKTRKPLLSLMDDEIESLEKILTKAQLI
jgi:4-hydroxy-2-oxoglutarate aldolase